MYLNPRRVDQHQDSWNYGIGNYPIKDIATIGPGPKVKLRGESGYKSPEAH
jgi:hypothetical protein